MLKIIMGLLGLAVGATIGAKLDEKELTKQNKGVSSDGDSVGTKIADANIKPENEDNENAEH